MPQIACDFQSHFGLISTHPSRRLFLTDCELSIPLWSYFNELRLMGYTQQWIELSIPLWSYFNSISKRTSSSSSSLSIPLWSYFNPPRRSEQRSNIAFQSHFGLISTFKKFVQLLAVLSFQSHFGLISTAHSALHSRKTEDFQSHFGLISTRRQKMARRLYRPAFNPTLVLFQRRGQRAIRSV